VSNVISNLLSIASGQGLPAAASQWSEGLVHWIDAPMPHEIRNAGAAATDLEYFKTDRTSHNAATEGYIDRAEQVSISFFAEKN
jgi:hypothetical protein